MRRGRFLLSVGNVKMNQSKAVNIVIEMAKKMGLCDKCVDQFKTALMSIKEDDSDDKRVGVNFCSKECYEVFEVIKNFANEVDN